MRHNIDNAYTTYTINGADNFVSNLKLTFDNTNMDNITITDLNICNMKLISLKFK